MLESTLYSRVAPCYDSVRKMDEDNLDKWLSDLIRYGRITRAKRVLELGCGTGRFTVPLWKKTRAKIVGFDLSESMIEIARSKDPSGDITWRLGDAADTKFPDCSFDCVFMVFVLHHLNNQIKALREIYRVLCPGGRVVIGTPSYGQFRKDVLYKLFPDLLTLDLARFPSIPRLKELMIAAGFSNVTSHYVKGKPAYLSRKQYLDWVLQKPLSGFPLLPQNKFEKCLSRIKRVQPGTQFKQCFVYHRCVYVMGVRPAQLTSI
jgi:SAM-dependent methyltransferase